MGGGISARKVKTPRSVYIYISICDLRPKLTSPIHHGLQPPQGESTLSTPSPFQTEFRTNGGKVAPHICIHANEGNPSKPFSLNRIAPELPGSPTGLPLDKSLKPKHSNVLVASRVTEKSSRGAIDGLFKARESIQAHALDRSAPELPGSPTGLPFCTLSAIGFLCRVSPVEEDARRDSAQKSYGQSVQ